MLNNPGKHCTFDVIQKMKKQLAEDMILFTTPFRERINDLIADEKGLDAIAAEGAEKARASARKTVDEIRAIIGF
jgi:tryptophanyl-tRNA synthetase